MQIRPLTPVVGAELEAIDLASQCERGFDKAVVEQLRQAFLDHHVLFIRDQSLSPAQLTQFSALFGPIGRYPFAEPIPGHPEVIAIIKEASQQTVFGGIWHTDSAYMQQPSMASVLYAVQVPDCGGDTLFANMHAAYETLDDELQQQLQQRFALHSSAKNRQRLRDDHLRAGAMSATDDDVFEAVHPVVRRHPQTGKPSLYLSPAHTCLFEGEQMAESEPLLTKLFAHALQDDFKCRFRWTPGTVAIWDNRCLLHYPVNDYHGHRREMWRVTIDGEQPLAMF